MFTAILTISLSFFFIIYFWFMLLGNRVSQTIEYILAKEADEELANINMIMREYELEEQDKQKRRK